MASVQQKGPGLLQHHPLRAIRLTVASCSPKCSPMCARMSRTGARVDFRAHKTTQGSESTSRSRKCTLTPAPRHAAGYRRCRFRDNDARFRRSPLSRLPWRDSVLKGEGSTSYDVSRSTSGTDLVLAGAACEKIDSATYGQPRSSTSCVTRAIVARASGARAEFAKSKR
jgi:hypothetical protein